MRRNILWLLLILMWCSKTAVSVEKDISVRYCGITISEEYVNLFHDIRVMVFFTVDNRGMPINIKPFTPFYRFKNEYKAIVENEAEVCVEKWRFQGFSGKKGMAAWHFSVIYGWYPLYIKIGDFTMSLDANPKKGDG